MHMPCNLNRFSRLIGCWLFLSAVVIACSAGGDDEATPTGHAALTDVTTNYGTVYRRELTAEELSGLLEPVVQAKVDYSGNLHLAFFTRGRDLDTSALPAGHDLIANPMRFQINHLVWSTIGGSVLLQERLDPAPPHSFTTPVDPSDSGIDNCLLLGLGLSILGDPVVVYQGGNRAEFTTGQDCNPQFQGDLMVSTRTGGIWQEYLGIQGDNSAKNPMHPDGTVGMSGDVAVDAQGNIHMIAQHFAEWCDQNAMNHPDLLYVQQTPADLGNYTTALEEPVDQVNLYGTGGGVQSAMGYHCRLILDHGDPQQPIVFYEGSRSNGDRQLRAAFREEGRWRIETIHTIADDFVVNFISPAISQDGTIGVAYFLERTNLVAGELGDHLMYAQRRVDEDGNISWDNIDVDIQSFCGNYCALAFDHYNLPAIAYYDERPYTPYRERHNAKLAYLVRQEWGQDWQKENVAFHGRIGLYNALWFDGNNIPYVVSYEREQIENSDEELHSIVVFRRDRQLSR
ncbi:MAG: hypothetical protein HKP58_11220 [Desulfatitalea sp.]|nr:hypothetical protein [Desulfatitalea sp.]NNK00972.1 hypothetical protein [Desulfatitalea sp.]